MVARGTHDRGCAGGTSPYGQGPAQPWEILPRQEYARQRGRRWEIAVGRTDAGYPQGGRADEFVEVSVSRSLISVITPVQTVDIERRRRSDGLAAGGRPVDGGTPDLVITPAAIPETPACGPMFTCRPEAVARRQHLRPQTVHEPHGPVATPRIRGTPSLCTGSNPCKVPTSHAKYGRRLGLSGLLLDPVGQLGHLVEDAASLCHELADLAVGMHHRGVVAAAELLADLR